MNYQIKTAEAVCQGHPDKLCDFIADAILDRALEQDPLAKTAIEVLAAGTAIAVAGEISCTATLPIRRIVREAMTDCGYTPEGFRIFLNIRSQSPDIAQAVNRAESIGAGDQGTVYGYATDETDERLPLPLLLSHKICRKMDVLRKDGEIQGIYSDGKAQVSVRYVDDKPLALDTVVVSVQHAEDKDLGVLRDEILSKVIRPVCENYLAPETEILLNPSGKFVVGGPTADTGLTGRKLMVDTYGGLAPHGGGAFSGKDGTKVDRSAAYYARLMARTIVDAGLAKTALISLSYAIGKAEPLALDVTLTGASENTQAKIKSALLEVFNPKPETMIRSLELCGGVLFQDLASYGHFGHWYCPRERTTPYVPLLLKAVGT